MINGDTRGRGAVARLAVAGRPARGLLDAGLGRLTSAECAARGKAERAAVPRESHAVYDPPAGRADPVALLERQASPRLPELVPIRCGRMLVSPLCFFRGAALLMAGDLAATPSSGLIVQACGDAHLSNFGTFASPERNLLFDVNDFDETLPGPWEWDVKRLAASLEVAARDSQFSRRQRRRIVTASARRYRTAMRAFSAVSNRDIWYARADLGLVRDLFLSQITSHRRKVMAKGLAKAYTRDSMQAFAKLAGVVDSRARIIADPPLIMPLSRLLPGQEDRLGFEAHLDSLIAKYRRTLEANHRFLFDRYQLTDLARMVVGVGSVGTRCWIALFQDRDGSDPLFLQVKEAQPSVLAPFAGASTYANQGQRVVQGQRLMQAASDIFLGWQRTEKALDGQPHDFYVRQLRDWKFSLDLDVMNHRETQIYGELCAWTLARAHARSGESIAIAAYLGKADLFDQAITEFAAAYADQNERDYQALAAAAATGRITAHSGL
jgi:uncharacterized protein (DUF2252 family)